MPYIKTTDPPFIKMRRLLLGYGYGAAKLAAVLGVSDPTARKRLEKPETLTLAEIDKIHRLAHIPMEELKTAISR